MFPGLSDQHGYPQPHKTLRRFSLEAAVQPGSVDILNAIPHSGMMRFAHLSNIFERSLSNERLLCNTYSRLPASWSTFSASSSTILSATSALSTGGLHSFFPALSSTQPSPEDNPPVTNPSNPLPSLITPPPNTLQQAAYDLKYHTRDVEPSKQ